MEAKEKAHTLQYQLGVMSSQVSSLSTMVNTLKAECTKAYKNGVSFVVSSLRTQAKKLDLTVPYFALMQAFQDSRSKAPITTTPQTSPRNTEVAPSGSPEGVVEEATP